MKKTRRKVKNRTQYDGEGNFVNVILNESGSKTNEKDTGEKNKKVHDESRETDQGMIEKIFGGKSETFDTPPPVPPRPPSRSNSEGPSVSRTENRTDVPPPVPPRPPSRSDSETLTPGEVLSEVRMDVEQPPPLLRRTSSVVGTYGFSQETRNWEFQGNTLNN